MSPNPQFSPAALPSCFNWRATSHPKIWWPLRPDNKILSLFLLILFSFSTWQSPVAVQRKSTLVCPSILSAANIWFFENFHEHTYNKEQRAKYITHSWNQGLPCLPQFQLPQTEFSQRADPVYKTWGSGHHLQHFFCFCACSRFHCERCSSYPWAACGSQMISSVPL